MNGGHYTATVYNSGAWYEYDDSIVEQIPETKVKS